MTTSLKVIATVGLPASGKSTWAREYASLDQNAILVSKDEIRAMIFGNGMVPWSQENERLTEAIRDEIVKEALGRGRSVIVHDTNLAAVHLKALSIIAGWYDTPFVTKEFIDVPIEECIRRDALRGDKSVGESVIRKMRSQYRQWWDSDA